MTIKPFVTRILSLTTADIDTGKTKTALELQKYCSCCNNLEHVDKEGYPSERHISYGNNSNDSAVMTVGKTVKVESTFAILQMSIARVQGSCRRLSPLSPADA